MVFITTTESKLRHPYHSKVNGFSLLIKAASRKKKKKKSYAIPGTDSYHSCPLGKQKKPIYIVVRDS
jgi:hypothetical protein